MSISSLVSEFGQTLYLYRPTNTVSSDGKPLRTYAQVTSFTGFIQPGAQGQDVLEGRQSGRTGGTIYVSGTLDVRIDDEIYSDTSGTVDRWRVTGASNPGEVGRLSASHRLNMTAIDVTEVEPGITP